MLLGFNAEDGSSATTTVTASLGSDFNPPREDFTKGSVGNAYLTVESTGGGESPGSAARVASYAVHFPEAGNYDLYARVLVEVHGADDSLFYGNGFGSKSPSSGSEWIHVNRIYDDPGGKGVGSGAYAWINLSEWTQTETGTTFQVPDAGEYTLQIGGREDGLWIDALAFGTATRTFTEAELDASVDASYERITTARVFIIGDSTVSNYNPVTTTQTGWGQVLFHYFANSVDIRNHADPGESTKTLGQHGQQVSNGDQGLHKGNRRVPGILSAGNTRGRQIAVGSTPGKLKAGRAQELSFFAHSGEDRRMSEPFETKHVRAAWSLGCLERLGGAPIRTIRSCRPAPPTRRTARP